MFSHSLLFALSWLVSVVLGTCPLAQSQMSSNVVFQKSTFASDDKLSLKDDTQFVLKCADTSHVFVNSVRNVDSVNITSLDADGRITGTCTVNSLIPNVFLDKKVVKDRVFYCAGGCNLLASAGQDITYPSVLYGNEANSPPMRIDKTRKVTLKCSDKFAQVVGNTGLTETACSSGGVTGWQHMTDNKELIKCVNGCPDITEIANGKTRAKVTGTTRPPTQPPFTIGDIVPYECNPGYTLVGHNTLTCTSDYQWHESKPQCVKTADASSSGRMYYSTVFCSLYALSVMLQS